MDWYWLLRWSKNGKDSLLIFSISPNEFFLTSGSDQKLWSSLKQMRFSGGWIRAVAHLWWTHGSLDTLRHSLMYLRMCTTPVETFEMEPQHCHLFASVLRLTQRFIYWNKINLWEYLGSKVTGILSKLTLLCFFWDPGSFSHRWQVPVFHVPSQGRSKKWC